MKRLFSLVLTLLIIGGLMYLMLNGISGEGVRMNDEGEVILDPAKSPASQKVVKDYEKSLQNRQRHIDAATQRSLEDSDARDDEHTNEAGWKTSKDWKGRKEW